MSACYCDYDTPEFWSSSKPRAKKKHRCYECNGEILPGEQYEYSANKYDGRMWQYHVCERCYDIRMFVQNNVPCFCYAYGGLQETAEEAIEDAYDRARDEVRGLWFGYQRRLILRNRFNAAMRTA